MSPHTEKLFCEYISLRRERLKNVRAVGEILKRHRSGLPRRRKDDARSAQRAHLVRSVG